MKKNGWKENKFIIDIQKSVFNDFLSPNTHITEKAKNKIDISMEEILILCFFYCLKISFPFFESNQNFIKDK